MNIGGGVDWNDVLKTIGSTAVVVGILGFVARGLFEHVLKRDFEAYRTQLAKDTEHRDRVRQEVLRWSNPILGGSLKELQGRLKNILEDEGYAALSSKSKDKLNPEWSIDHEYFFSSTVFLFAKYFCWVSLLEERLSFELFKDRAERDKFFGKLNAVARTLATFPLEELKSISGGGDLQVFRLQQRGIGEAFYVSDGTNLRAMRYTEFLEKWRDHEFQCRFKPLTRFLEGLEPSNKLPWQRLELMKGRLHDLQLECEQLFGAKTLSRTTPRREALG